MAQTDRTSQPAGGSVRDRNSKAADECEGDVRLSEIGVDLA
jgi:hypothetical protein